MQEAEAGNQPGSCATCSCCFLQLSFSTCSACCCAVVMLSAVQLYCPGPHLVPLQLPHHQLGKGAQNVGHLCSRGAVQWGMNAQYSGSGQGWAALAADVLPPILAGWGPGAHRARWLRRPPARNQTCGDGAWLDIEDCQGAQDCALAGHLWGVGQRWAGRQAGGRAGGWAARRGDTQAGRIGGCRCARC